MADWDTGVEATASPVSLMELLKQVPDLRSLHGLRHPLSALLGLTVVAVLAGMRGPEAIAQFGRPRMALAPAFGLFVARKGRVRPRSPICTGLWMSKRLRRF